MHINYNTHQHFYQPIAMGLITAIVIYSNLLESVRLVFERPGNKTK